MAPEVRLDLLIFVTRPPNIYRKEILDPANLCTVYVSPRIRAHKTFHLLFDHVEKLPDHVITEEVREWDYGEYEGLLPSEIKAKRPDWSVWKDGCPGGESAEEMSFRVDLVIEKVDPSVVYHVYLLLRGSLGQGAPQEIFRGRNRVPRRGHSCSRTLQSRVHRSMEQIPPCIGYAFVGP